MKDLEKFIEHIQNFISNDEFIKIILSNKRDKTSDLKSIYLKLVTIKGKQKLNFVYKHNTKDITKNFSIKESLLLLEQLLKENFFQASLFNTSCNYNLLLRKDDSSSLKKTKASIAVKQENQHDKVKVKNISIENNIYLKELGIVNASGNIVPKKQRKFKQINKYIEVIDNTLSPIGFKDEFTIIDMGAGKGYLTFALYDFLKNKTNMKPQVIGVELRPELVEICNKIADQANFDQLKFIEGSIQNAELPKIDVMIALHACDTATDDAIYRGIESEAEVIICAPCCHKQIRKQLNPTSDLKLVTQFGILKERQAELLTDALRALLLESQGYKTKVFEFISTEHTPKNVLIVATKNKNAKKDEAKIMEQIKNIKNTYGIGYHYLEKLLSGDKKYFI